MGERCTYFSKSDLTALDTIVDHRHRFCFFLPGDGHRQRLHRRARHPRATDCNGWRLQEAGPQADGG